MAGSWLVVVMTALGARVPASDLAAAHAAFRDGRYDEAARVLGGLAERLPRLGDHVRHLAAESEFYAGRPGRAAELFAQVARMRDSRFAAMAPWRQADALWADGRRAEAGRRYEKLLARGPAAGDPVVARFRLAELERDPSETARRLVRIAIESPAHPLGERAFHRLRDGDPARPALPAWAPAPAERLARAARLAGDRHYQAALDELGALPAELPPGLRAERDLEMGMAKYRMRRDYLAAAGLLLGAASGLRGEKAALAAFHGARALSRADRDDEAIDGYRRVLRDHPGSRWAPEAQFRAGWLDFIRGRYREALPGLAATEARFPRSDFAADAAWFTALAHYFLGQGEPARAALERFARRSQGAGAAAQALYWRGRVLELMGHGDEARAIFADCARRWPLGYYGLVARARLGVSGAAARVALPPAAPEARATRTARAPTPSTPVQLPALARAEDLMAAGLAHEAADEIDRASGALLEARGGGLGVVLGAALRMGAFRRAYQLAETRGGDALAAEPAGAGRLVWEAAYPRAFRALVERESRAFEVPDLFVYAIMRKESSFAPYQTSSADARGLLQIVPPTARRVAERLGMEMDDDQIFDPEINVRLGAAYLGGLYKKFRGQVALAAAAYNAGPRAAVRWCEQNGARPLDEFVELIAFEQSREYAKRVLGIYARYLHLYGGEAYLPALAVDCRIAADWPAD